MHPLHFVPALALAAVVSAGASAATITVDNASFESPLLNVPTTRSDSGQVTDWVEVGLTANVGVMSETYNNAGDNTPAAPEGTQWLYLRTSANTAQTNGAWQDVSTGALDPTIQADQTYTLSLTVGHNDVTPVGTSYLFGLYTDDGTNHTPTQLLAQKTQANVTFDVNNKSTQTITYAANDNPSFVGRHLYVLLSTTSGSTGVATRTLFDEVSLTSVPEPTSIGLLGLGGLALLGRRRCRMA